MTKYGSKTMTSSPGLTVQQQRQQQAAAGAAGDEHLAVGVADSGVRTSAVDLVAQLGDALGDGVGVVAARRWPSLAAALTGSGTSKSGRPMLRLIGSFRLRARSNTLRMPDASMLRIRSAIQAARVTAGGHRGSSCGAAGGRGECIGRRPDRHGRPSPRPHAPRGDEEREGTVFTNSLHPISGPAGYTGPARGGRDTHSRSLSRRSLPMRRRTYLFIGVVAAVAILRCAAVWRCLRLERPAGAAGPTRSTRPA